MNWPRRALWFALAFTVLWAIEEAVVGSVLTRYSPFQVVWTRYGVHLLALIVLFAWRGAGDLVRTRRVGYQIARSLLMLTMPASWIVGRDMGMPMSGFMPVFWLSPLLVMGFSWVVLGERPSTKIWIAGALASAGAMLQFGGRLPAFSWQLMFPLTMAASFSLYIVMTRSLRDENVSVNLFYAAFGVFVALTLMMPGVWKTPGSLDIGVMAIVGLLGLAGLYFLERMASATEVSLTAPLIAGQVLLMTAASSLEARGLPARLTMVGALAVGLSALMIWRFTTPAAAGQIRPASNLQGSI